MIGSVTLANWPLPGAHFKLLIGELAISEDDRTLVLRCPVQSCGLVFRLANELVSRVPVTIAGRVQCPGRGHAFTVSDGIAEFVP